MRPEETGRLLLTAFACGLLGAAVGAVLGARPAAADPAATVDTTLLTESMRELRDEMRRLGASRPDQPEVDRVPVSRPTVAPREPERERAAFDCATVDRFLVALQQATERLEKLAEGQHRSAHLVDMLQGMAKIPRTPQQVDEVARRANLHHAAGQDLLYASPTRVVEVLGSPVSANADASLGTVTWRYEVPPGDRGVSVTFLGNHVVEAWGF